MNAGASTFNENTPLLAVEKPKKSPLATGQQAPDTDHLKKQDIKSLKGSNDSKDKTQLAATTSMAVIHVGILKALVDLGPDVHSYYYWCLGLIITALVLQLISGIIAIYIATIKSFQSEFKFDFSYYCKRSCCPCIVKSRSKVSSTGGGSGSNPTRRSQNDTPENVEHDQSSQSGCSMCGQKNKSTDALEYEELILNSYFVWETENGRMQQDTANINQMIALLEESLDDLTTLREVTDPNVPKRADIDQRIAKQEQHLKLLTKKQHESLSLQQKGKVLTTQLKYVLNQKVMKRAAFWQCILTILTYVIFVLNTIMSGFGLSNLAKA